MQFLQANFISRTPLLVTNAEYRERVRVLRSANDGQIDVLLLLHEHLLEFDKSVLHDVRGDFLLCFKLLLQVSRYRNS